MPEEVNARIPRTNEFKVIKEVEIRYTPNWLRCVRIYSISSKFSPDQHYIEITDIGIRNHTDSLPYPSLEAALRHFSTLLKGTGTVKYIKT